MYLDRCHYFSHHKLINRSFLPIIIHLILELHRHLHCIQVHLVDHLLLLRLAPAIRFRLVKIARVQDFVQRVALHRAQLMLTLAVWHRLVFFHSSYLLRVIVLQIQIQAREGAGDLVGLGKKVLRVP